MVVGDSKVTKRLGQLRINFHITCCEIVIDCLLSDLLTSDHHLNYRYIRNGYIMFINTAPLTPAVFHILLALADGEKHGYAIMKQVEADGGGFLRMGPGTLYGSLQRMSVAGLVEEIQESEEERRRFYRLTGSGQKALNAELARLRAALSSARKKGVALPASAARK